MLVFLDPRSAQAKKFGGVPARATVLKSRAVSCAAPQPGPPPQPGLGTRTGSRRVVMHTGSHMHGRAITNGRTQIVL